MIDRVPGDVELVQVATEMWGKTDTLSCSSAYVDDTGAEIRLKKGRGGLGDSQAVVILIKYKAKNKKIKAALKRKRQK